MFKSKLIKNKNLERPQNRWGTILDKTFISLICLYLFIFFMALNNPIFSYPSDTTYYNDTIYVIYKKIKNFSIKKQKNISSLISVSQIIEQNPNIYITKNADGNYSEIKFEGLRGYHNNYYLNSIPITLETTSSFDYSIFSFFINQVYLKYNGDDEINNPLGVSLKFKMNPIKDNIALLSYNSLNNKKIFSNIYFNQNQFNVFFSTYWADIKNRFSILNYNGTLYNLNDDYYIEYNIAPIKQTTIFTYVDSPYFILKNKIIKLYFFIITGNKFSTFHNVFFPEMYQISEKKFYNIYSLYFKTILSDNLMFHITFYDHIIYNRLKDIYGTSYLYFFNQTNLESNNKRKTFNIKIKYYQNFLENNLSVNLIKENYDNFDSILNQTLTSFYRNRFIISNSIKYKKIVAKGSLTYYKNNALFVNRLFIYDSINTSKNITTDYSLTFNILNTKKYLMAFFILNGYRIPSLIELFGDNYFIIPNPYLKNEKLLFKYGISIKRIFSNIILGMSIFHLKAENIIKSVYYPNYNLIKFENIEKAEIKSLTLFFLYRTQRLKNEIYLTISDNRNKTEGIYFNKILPYTSKYRIKNHTELKINKSINIYSDLIYSSMCYTFKSNIIYDHPKDYQYLVYGNYGFLPSNLKLNIVLNYQKNYITYNIKFDNILNNRVTLNPKYPEPGRSYSFEVIYKY